jgi:hypothetical protein
MPGQEDLDALRADIRKAQEEVKSRFGSYPDFDLDVDHRSLGDLEIENRLGFHKGTIEGPNASSPRHAYLRVAFMEFMDMLDRVLPNGRAKSFAMAELEMTSMWAHKAVAQLAPVTHE